MFTNYLKIAWRNMLRNKANTIINFTGLATGLTCVILIVIYIKHELSFDRFLPGSNRIYQVNLDANFGGQALVGGYSPPTVGPAIHTEFPEIETYTRIYRMGNEVVKKEAGAQTRYFNEPGILAVDSNFLQVFRFAMKEGNAASCLQKPGSVVISQSTAQKYFGNEPAMGKLLSFDEYNQPFVVTGIVKNVPTQSTIQFDMLIPTSSCPPVKRFSWSWVWCNMSTYVVLKDKALANADATVAHLDSQFPAMVKKLAVKAFARIGQPFDEFIRKGGKWDFHLQPLQNIHLHSAGISMPFNNLGSITHVYTFGIVALFIIILACVNFMNLSTARAIKRAREVGIRKVLGSERKALIRQFLAEAMLYSSIAGVIAILLSLACLPAFNHLAQKNISILVLVSPSILGLVLALIVFTGLLAGSYPAFYLTSFNPIVVLKGESSLPREGGGRFLRNGLVTFQFAVSVILVICTLVVYKQLEYTREKDMGLHKDNVVIINNLEKITGSHEAFRNQLATVNGVKAVSISTGLPSGGAFTDFFVPETNASETIAKDLALSSYMTDEYLVNTLQLQLIQGRNFSKEFNDSASVIINETTAKQIGWKNPVGQYMRYPGGHDEKYKVIGVVKDFNTESLHAMVTPFALFHHNSQIYHENTSYAILSVSDNNMQTLLQQLQQQWKGFIQDTPFDYSFLDKNFEALYRADAQMGAVFGLFTILALIIACLGLFGLSVYTTESRTKEIGIRKVLGASEQRLVILLSKDFIKPVLLATIIAFPVAWWAMDKWLLDFAYRIPLKWWFFVVSGAAALGIALATVSSQTLKAALTKPIKNLKAE